ncbi:MAG: PD40 domain-containing protein [Chloroflexi bacterium]|nr:PD40 domain-containing protein [Chloroflexota bacterium]MBI5714664.1 PD40 domain-containing protein [Chloroflexota bacterium]
MYPPKSELTPETPKTNLNQAISANYPVWSPDGKYLFASCSFRWEDWEFLHFEACLSKPDRTGLVRLQESVQFLNDPNAAWSPDGSQVVFNNYIKTILVSMPSGSKKEVLEDDCYSTKWSSDSQRFVCSIYHEIVLIDLFQNKRMTVTYSPRESFESPTWSEVDHQKIYFIRARDFTGEFGRLRWWSKYDLFEFNISSEKKSLLVENLDSPIVFWSKDEQTVYYLRDKKEASGNVLYSLNVSSKQEKRVAEGLPRKIVPSPDRQSVVYVVNDGWNSSLLLLQIEKAVSKKLLWEYEGRFCFHGIKNLVWSHNGKYLAFTAQRFEGPNNYEPTWIIEIDSGKIFQIPTTQKIDDVKSIDWSPNDSLIAITDNPSSQIYKILIEPTDTTKLGAPKCK